MSSSFGLPTRPGIPISMMVLVFAVGCGGSKSSNPNQPSVTPRFISINYTGTEPVFSALGETKQLSVTRPSLTAPPRTSPLSQT